MFALSNRHADLEHHYRVGQAEMYLLMLMLMADLSALVFGSRPNVTKTLFGFGGGSAGDGSMNTKCAFTKCASRSSFFP